jgi:dCMP deaminase
MRPSRDEFYSDLTSLVSLRGTCIRRQVGCVLVDKRGCILSTGYNGVATGRPHCSEGHPCKGACLPSGEGLDLCEAIHAEQNAILLLSDPWIVDTCYVTCTPCISCLKLLLGTSCKRIVARYAYSHTESLSWWSSAGRSMEILNPQGRLVSLQEKVLDYQGSLF